MVEARGRRRGRSRPRGAPRSAALRGGQRELPARRAAGADRRPRAATDRGIGLGLLDPRAQQDVHQRVAAAHHDLLGRPRPIAARPWRAGPDERSRRRWRARRCARRTAAAAAICPGSGSASRASVAERCAAIGRAPARAAPRARQAAAAVLGQVPGTNAPAATLRSATGRRRQRRRSARAARRGLAGPGPRLGRAASVGARGPRPYRVAELRGQDASGEADPEGADDHRQQDAAPAPRSAPSALHAFHPTRRFRPCHFCAAGSGLAATTMLYYPKSVKKNLVLASFFDCKS